MTTNPPPPPPPDDDDSDKKEEQIPPAPKYHQTPVKADFSFVPPEDALKYEDVTHTIRPESEESKRINAEALRKLDETNDYWRKIRNQEDADAAAEKADKKRRRAEKDQKHAAEVAGKRNWHDQLAEERLVKSITETVRKAAEVATELAALSESAKLLRPPLMRALKQSLETALSTIS